MFDLSEVSYVKRIVIGNTDPANPLSQAAIESQTELLNRCLNNTPKGRIIGIEKTLASVEVAGRQEALQALVYHVGFTRKPHWLNEHE